MREISFDRPHFGNLLKILLVWAAIWTGIYGVVYLLEPDYPRELLMGVGAAAAVSLLLTAGILWSHWQGEIEEIRMERRRCKRRWGNGRVDTYWVETPMALVRRPGGKLKKVPCCPDWEVGDYLVKRRWELNAEVVAKRSG